MKCVTGDDSKSDDEGSPTSRIRHREHYPGHSTSTTTTPGSRTHDQHSEFATPGQSFRGTHHGSEFATPGQSFRDERHLNFATHPNQSSFPNYGYPEGWQDYEYDEPSRTSTNLEDEIAHLGLSNSSESEGGKGGHHRRKSSRFSPTRRSSSAKSEMGPDWVANIPEEFYEGMATNLGPSRRPSQEDRRDDFMVANPDWFQHISNAGETPPPRFQSLQNDQRTPPLLPLEIPANHLYQPPGLQDMQKGMWSGAAVPGHSLQMEAERPSTTGLYSGAGQADVERHERHLEEVVASRQRKGKSTRVPGLPRPNLLRGTSSKNKQSQEHPYLWE